jgi:hypothetical protein
VLRFRRAVRVDERAQFKQVYNAKEALSSPHDNDRINGAEVGKVFRNRSRAPIPMLKIHAVLRQTFPAAQLFEFLPKQRMEWMHYPKPLQPLVTTVCSA